MSEIKNWYKAQSVLVTGATGYIGKVLVEKLLRECSEVKTIYLLMRSNRKFTVNERGEQFIKHYIDFYSRKTYYYYITQDDISNVLRVTKYSGMDTIRAVNIKISREENKELVFDKIRQNNPSTLNKIKTIESDLTSPQLGLSNENLLELKQNVNIIIHCAASVRFDQKLADAFKSNIYGTRSLLTIARDMLNLKVFVYVSTAYSQNHLQTIEERHYDSPIDINDLAKIIDKYQDNSELLALSDKFLGCLPNTYSFSKAITEDLVYRHREYFPIAIIRPSIVVACVDDPLPNFLEGFHGLSGYMIATGMGLLRSLNLNADNTFNVIPGDIVANTIIVAGWVKGSTSSTICYYNCADSMKHCATQRVYLDYGRQLINDHPFDFSFFYPDTLLTESKIIHYIVTLFKQLIPSLLVDMILRLCGKRTIMMFLQRRIFSYTSVLIPYISVNYLFITENFQSLSKHLNEVDQKLFNIKRDEVAPEKIIKCLLIGCRKYVLNEKDDTMPRALTIIKTLKWIKIIFHTIIIYFVLTKIWEYYLLR